MPQLPDNPNFEHLKKQAKDLLHQIESKDHSAFDQLREFLPAAEGKTDAEITAMGLKLHDAQSCIARSYGLPAWQNLRNYVDWSKSRFSTERKDVIPLWVHKAYGHDTEMLLDAGADPNDSESLYHAVEGAEPDCLRLLLEAGARVERSNALHHHNSIGKISTGCA